MADFGDLRRAEVEYKKINDAKPHPFGSGCTSLWSYNSAIIS